MTIHTSMTKTKEEDSKWIQTSNYLLDTFIKEGLPTGNVSYIISKSRGVGKTLYNHRKLWLEWRKTNRLMKLKRYFNNYGKK